MKEVEFKDFNILAKELKIIKIKNCWECPYHNTIEGDRLGCTQNGKEIKNTSIIDKDCLLESYYDAI